MHLYTLGYIYSWYYHQALQKSANKEEIYLFLSYTLNSFIHFFHLFILRIFAYDSVSDSILILGKVCLQVVFNPSALRERVDRKKETSDGY